MTKRCRSQIEKGSRTTFCSLVRDHRGDHEGYKLTWKTDGPGVSEYEERPKRSRQSSVDSSQDPKKPEASKHDGPVWSASCQHCKHPFVIAVHPDQVSTNTSIVVCPKCGQTGLFWFEQEPRGFKKGAVGLPAVAFPAYGGAGLSRETRDVGLKRTGHCPMCARLYHQRFEGGVIEDYCPNGCLKFQTGTRDPKTGVVTVDEE